MPHLLVDISAHGFGHVSQTAPVVNALAQLIPTLQVTLRSGAPEALLRQRFQCDFLHIPATFDFGMTMVNALDVNVEESALRYRDFHANWQERVAGEAEVMRQLKADVLLANIPYLSLAAAQMAGLPSVAMCSLNWADIYRHYGAAEAAGDLVLAQMLAAYNSAQVFLQPAPSMAMPYFSNGRSIGPIASLSRSRRVDLAASASAAEKMVLVAMGGIELRLPVEAWPRIAGVRWLLPAAWQVTRSDVSAIESYGRSFSEVLASSDAVLTKPGYGTFTEAACAGVPVLYVTRGDWPEEPYLVSWLKQHTACVEVARSALQTGQLAQQLEQLWGMPRPPAPIPNGAQQAAAYLRDLLTGLASSVKTV